MYFYKTKGKPDTFHHFSCSSVHQNEQFQTGRRMSGLKQATPQASTQKCQTSSPRCCLNGGRAGRRRPTVHTASYAYRARTNPARSGRHAIFQSQLDGWDWPLFKGSRRRKEGPPKVTRSQPDILNSHFASHADPISRPCCRRATRPV